MNKYQFLLEGIMDKSNSGEIFLKELDNNGFKRTVVASNIFLTEIGDRLGDDAFAFYSGIACKLAMEGILK